MGRAFLSLLLIVNLLLCPLRCFSCAAADVETDCSAQFNCACCADRCDLPAADPPVESPDEECTCQDCICEGATLQDAQELPDASTGAEGYTIRLACIPSVGNRKPAVAHPHDRNLMLGGRGMRIAHQSLLN